MTQLTNQIKVQLIDVMGDQRSIVRAARVSTKGKDSANSNADLGLLGYLYREGHGVPFESTVMQFYIEAPIFVTRQILKHRISSINEESGRYKELEGKFYVPGPSRKVKQVGKTGHYNFVADAGLNSKARAWISLASRVSWFSYRTMIRAGISKEVARMVLPVNLYSSLYLTINLRSALNFVALRVDWGADAVKPSKPQAEIEEVALQIGAAIANQYPDVWEAFMASGCQAV
jgi:thymidylate synthase (FAD)